MAVERPAPLTLRPDGLLSLLGLQTNGRYPQRMGESLAPTLDLLPWYLAATGTELNVFSTNVATFGFNAVFTVPDNEIWLVESIVSTATATIAAGRIWGGQWAWQPYSGSLSVPRWLGPLDTTLWTNANGDRPGLYVSPEPFFLARGGARFGINTFRLSGAAAVNMDSTIRFARCAP
jgi:hypothetical protein